jgi:predicted acyltransferase
MASTTAPELLSPSAQMPVIKPARLVSLDVFRGLTVAAMILVTNPGTYSAVYWPLLHAEWRGWTLTDMIFPSFLFIVGVSMTLSFASRQERRETRSSLARHLLMRVVLLIAIGLFLNGFPFFDLHTLRIPGVLQRIALCYLIGGLFYLSLLPASGNGAASTRRRVWALSAAIIVLVLGYWLTLRYFPVPGFGPNRFDSFGNLGAYIDRGVFGTRHMWPYGTTPGYGVTFDPEGLLSTLPATANLLVGLLTGELLRTRRSGLRKAVVLGLAGMVLFSLGMALGPVLPIVKKIWTSSFVLLSAGFSLMALCDYQHDHPADGRDPCSSWRNVAPLGLSGDLPSLAEPGASLTCLCAHAGRGQSGNCFCVLPEADLPPSLSGSIRDLASVSHSVLADCAVSRGRHSCTSLTMLPPRTNNKS